MYQPETLTLKVNPYDVPPDYDSIVARVAASFSTLLEDENNYQVSSDSMYLSLKQVPAVTRKVDGLWEQRDVVIFTCSPNG